MSKKKIPEALNAVIHTYIAALKADHLPINQVFLFGSYAKGFSHAYSDVDICVVSSKFSDYITAIQYLLSKRKLNIQYPLNLLEYTLKISNLAIHWLVKSKKQASRLFDKNNHTRVK